MEFSQLHSTLKSCEFENYFSADTIYVGISLDTISINTMCVDTNGEDTIKIFDIWQDQKYVRNMSWKYQKK